VLSCSPRAALLLAATVGAPALVAAQTAPAAPPAAAAPAAAALAAPVGPPVAIASLARSLKAGTWKWAAKLNANGQEQEFGTRTLSLEKGTAADTWLLLDAQQNPMVTSSDSVVLASGDLATVRRALKVQSPMGAITLAMAFTADSVTGALEAPGQKMPIAATNPKGAIVSDGLLLLALSQLPLAEGWTGRIDLLNPQNGGVIPLSLSVRRSEKVTVPAGAFDTWVVETTGGPATATFFVAKGGPVVRLVAAVPQVGGTVESVLTK
jgi:hypothetical protein